MMKLVDSHSIVNYLDSSNVYTKTGMDILKHDYFSVKIPCDVKKYYANIYDTVNVVNVQVNNEGSIDEIRNKLKAFRTETSKNMNIPPYYVFNNEEMEKLLETMPKTLEELKALNILPAVKVNTHGKKIIEILNS